MPRGANTQTRTFVYNTGNTVGVRLLSATNPENGTVSYTYNTDGTLNTKTDAKNQVFTYTYDSYKRVTQISVGGNVLRTFVYDNNTLDNTFSGSYTAGRLVAVQHSAFNPGTVSAIQFTEMYSYTQPGQAAKKRLQVNETLPYGQGQNIARTLNLDAAQTYDTEGKMTSVNYPTTYGLNGASTTGPTYSYQFDNMHRPSVLTDQNSSVIVNNLQYGPANELKQISYGGLTETRQYNAMLQMTHLSIPGQLDITYNFPGSANNGKITSQTDNLSGETISYQYDSLNRLLSASASGWNQTFGYDGFGSLVSKSGTNAPVLSIAVDPATNRIVGQTYDANGNQLTGGLGYDPENRIQTAPGVQYAYDSQNKRIWRGTFDGNGNLTAQEAYFYGVGGQKLGTYALTVVQQNNQQPQLTDSNTDSAVFFGSKRVLSGGGAFIQDRLGSARRSQSGAAMSFYPYGEDKGTLQPNDQLKFGTYTRDTATGLDYADQRYYANQFGRFMTVDPGPAVLTHPQSWNRYTYSANDPVNINDPTGQFIGPYGCFGSLDQLIDATSDASIGCPVFFFDIGEWQYLRPNIPSPAQRRAEKFDNISADLGDLVSDWSFTDENYGTVNVVFSSDYSQFIQYLQQCGCDTVNWADVFKPVTDRAAQVLVMGLTTYLALDKIFKKEHPIGRPKNGVPTGTKPIDQWGDLTHDQIEDIKKDIGARAPDWVGIDPDGNVWTGSPSGDAIPHGRWDQYTHH